MTERHEWDGRYAMEDNMNSQLNNYKYFKRSTLKILTNGTFKREGHPKYNRTKLSFTYHQQNNALVKPDSN